MSAAASDIASTAARSPGGRRASLVRSAEMTSWDQRRSTAAVRQTRRPLPIDRLSTEAPPSYGPHTESNDAPARIQPPRANLNHIISAVPVWALAAVAMAVFRVAVA